MYHLYQIKNAEGRIIYVGMWDEFAPMSKCRAENTFREMQYEGVCTREVVGYFKTLSEVKKAAVQLKRVLDIAHVKRVSKQPSAVYAREVRVKKEKVTIIKRVKVHFATDAR
jgi:hypothetical protein